MAVVERDSRLDGYYPPSGVSVELEPTFLERMDQRNRVSP